MFIKHIDKLPHEYVGKIFALNEDVSNMEGTFEKGTELLCISVNSVPEEDKIEIGPSGVISLWLQDEHRNRLHLNKDDFFKNCTPL
jgi:hypothetical protein